MADSVMAALRDVCADVDGNVDEEMLQKLCSRLQHYASDQGTSAAKCGQVLTQRPELPNLVWLSADMAHQVRKIGRAHV